MVSRLQRLTTGWLPRRCPGLQPKMREDLLDHRLLKDRRNDLQLAAAVRAVLQVKIEHALEQLGPAQTHRLVMHAVRLALGGRRGLGGSLGLLRHHLRAQLGVGRQHAMKTVAAQLLQRLAVGLHLSSVAELTRYALREGLTSLDTPCGATRRLRAARTPGAN